MMRYRNRFGFTLIELLVVMALFGALATVSTSGYYAVVRGIEERGAIAAATSVARAAQQRARIDRVKTALFLYNELVRPESSTEDSVAQGVAVAVRMGGRISLVDDKYLCDEFADLDEIYGLGDEQKPTDEGAASRTPGMRLYQWAKDVSGDTAQELKYSIVGSQVVLRQKQDNTMFDFKSKNGGSSGGSGKVDYANMMQMYSFYMKDGMGVKWRNGDAYAFEFATIRLPVGYYFGYGSEPTRPTSKNPVEPVKACFFDPQKTGTDLQHSDSIQIYTLRGTDKSGEPKLMSIGKLQSDAEKI